MFPIKAAIACISWICGRTFCHLCLDLFASVTLVDVNFNFSSSLEKEDIVY